MTTNVVNVGMTNQMVSIVIPCCGMLEYTKWCVPSVLKHSRSPYELIFVDIASLDGTAEYLAGLQAGLSGQVRVEVVRTPTDLGLKAACRQALRQTLGEYIVLLNNDCVVTSGWLNQLIGLVGFSTGIGLVGPMSNMAAPPQLVETVPYRLMAGLGKAGTKAGSTVMDLAAVERFAAELSKEQNGNWMYAERLGGFCLLIKRAVLDRIGTALDEWTDLSLFDTDILSAKATQAGFSLAVCRDLFVHHFGTRTFTSSAPVKP